MRIVMILLLCLSVLMAKESSSSKINLQLEASGTLFADGNMAINQSEQFGWYFLPQLGGELSFTKLPLTLFFDLAYDGYLSKRDIDDRTPLIDGGILSTIGKNAFKNRFRVRSRIYGGSDLYLDGESESSSLTIGMRSYSLESRSRWKGDKFSLSLSLEGTYRDLGTKAEGGRSDETSLDVDVTPRISYRLKKSEKSLKLTSLALEALWRERFAVDPDENQRKQELALELKGKAWKSRWQITLGGAYKSFAKEYDNEFTSQMKELTWSELFVEPSLTLPLPAGLSVGLTGEVCKRSSTISRHDFRDNRVGLVLGWKIKW